MKRLLLLLLIFLLNFAGTWTDGWTPATPLATDDETVTGTAKDKATTPANVKALLTNTGYDVGIGSTTAGKNLTVNATAGTAKPATWTASTFTTGGGALPTSAPASGWWFDTTGNGGLGSIKHVGGATTTLVSTDVTTTISPITTYKVIVTGTGGTATCPYQLGSTNGTTLPASGSLGIADYVTPMNAYSNTALVVTPGNTSTIEITSIAVQALTDNTGDFNASGNIFPRSQLLLPRMGGTMPQIASIANTTTGMNIDPDNSVVSFDIGGTQTLKISGSGSSQALQYGNGNSGNMFTLASEDAPLIMALRYGGSQNTERIYNKWTDFSNYERMTLTGVQGASVNLTAETAGTGADNLNIVLTPAGTGIVTTPANIYTSGDVSALTFTDRTPDFEGDALAALKPVTGKDGEIDHTTLPAFAQREIKRTVVNSVTENKVEVPKEEALEEVEVEATVMESKPIQTVDAKTGEVKTEMQRQPIASGTETKYELVNGEVQAVEKPIQQTETKTQIKLKAGVTLDATDGKFYRTETIVDKEEITAPGRDLGAMISILTKAVQQLTAENDLLKERIGKLEAR